MEGFLFFLFFFLQKRTSQELLLYLIVVSRIFSIIVYLVLYLFFLFSDHRKHIHQAPPIDFPRLFHVSFHFLSAALSNVGAFLIVLESLSIHEVVVFEWYHLPLY